MSANSVTDISHSSLSPSLEQKERFATNKLPRQKRADASWLARSWVIASHGRRSTSNNKTFITTEKASSGRSKHSPEDAPKGLGVTGLTTRTTESGRPNITDFRCRRAEIGKWPPMNGPPTRKKEEKKQLVHLTRISSHPTEKPHCLGASQTPSGHIDLEIYPEGERTVSVRGGYQLKQTKQGFGNRNFPKSNHSPLTPPARYVGQYLSPDPMHNHNCRETKNHPDRFEIEISQNE
ncbi:hypothetical protein GWI33_013707 [Rhynchophorus ferrugineus]|uniref:Uncharacterized protein n=1 Tax=Rhynchophorus ferrugineus TaxID=354439 RepID=A0A834MD06_RHYFE|nr:hypothetical protein GWI33_013707 [Rhynchophorus ferrugineus]